MTVLIVLLLLVLIGLQLFFLWRLAGSAAPLAGLSSEPPLDVVDNTNPVQVKQPLSDTQILWLMAPHGAIEHEVSWHQRDVPFSFTYQDKIYRQRDHRADGTWEFVR